MSNMQSLEKQLEVYEQAENHFAALETLEKINENSPENESILTKLGIKHLKIGNVDIAEKLLQSCLVRNPENTLASLNLGHALKAKGRTKEAAEYYRLLVENRDDSEAAIGYWSLADLKDFRFDQATMISLKTRIDTSQVKPGYKALMMFAFACSLEQSGNYQQAFEVLKKANDIINAHRPFRGDLYNKLIKSILAELTSQPDLVRHRIDEEPHPIFVVGMPRSGTTLIEQILASHSLVEATDELPFLERIGLELEKKGGYAYRLSRMSRDEVETYAKQYLSQVMPYRKRKAPYFIDKNPANFLHIGLIKTLFPHAKIINVIRDPLDNAMSVYKQYFNQGNDYSYSLEGIIYYWQGYVTLMNHWQTLYNKDIFHIAYEDLARRPDKRIKRLLKYCSLKEEAACFKFYESDRAVLTPSASQVRQPITNKSVGSGKIYQPFVQSYIAQLTQIKLKSKAIFGI